MTAIISDVYIANMALAAIPAPRIQSMNESSIEAKECRGAYRSVVDEMLEAFPWSFANARVTLAETDNDRAFEWAYAYRLPSGAVPERIASVSGFAAAGAATVARMASYGASEPFRMLDPVGYPYMVAGGTLYTDAGAALLDYRDTAVTEARFTSLFARAVALELASRICLAISKSDTRFKTLVSQAAAARETAQSADYNRNPQTYSNHMPETLAARY